MARVRDLPLEKTGASSMPTGRERTRLVQPRDRDASLPTIVVTGGVHGALKFLEQAAGEFAGRANLRTTPAE
jgi:hypothetical protein